MRHSENLKIRFKRDNTLTIVISAVILVGILMILLKLGSMSVYATKGDEISDITNHKARLVEENKKIESDIANLQSLQRIEKEAKDRLGMVKAKPIIYLDITK